jgi:hypothetical protein
MRRLSMSFTRVACALPALLGLLAGCVDGTPVGPDTGMTAAVLLAPILSGGATASLDAPISSARLTARDATSGAIYGSVVVQLDPSAEEWTLPMTLDLPSGENVRVVVTIELLATVNGSLVVQWSGLTTPLAVGPGDQPSEVHEVPLYRGPPENLGVTGVKLTNLPQAVTEGDAFAASAVVSGGGAGSAVFFGSLDPSIATVTTDGKVKALKRGTARIVATAGPKADTAAVLVKAWPLPDQGTVAVIDPGLEDAAGRVLPSLSGDAAGASTLRGLVSTIRSALSQGLGFTAEQALVQARQALASYGGGGAAAAGDGPELSIVGLVLDHVERILNAAR